MRLLNIIADQSLNKLCGLAVKLRSKFSQKPSQFGLEQRQMIVRNVDLDIGKRKMIALN